MLYIDTTIFVHATLNNEDYGNKAEALLQKIAQGEEQAMTSVLTFDEVFWAVKKNRGIEKALEAGQTLLNFPHLEIVPATREIASLALQIIKECGLRPRDALHAATAIAEKADYIVSTDIHFDRVKQLKRKDYGMS
jgi:predicted nucleic acid-binding protein